MKKTLSFYYSTLFIFCQIAICCGGFLTKPAAAVNTQDFYFDSFKADYYISEDIEGVSHMKVYEELTAIFPEYKQNKGICRMIPKTNQNGKNVTLKELNRSNIKVTRNGKSEPIYSIDETEKYFEVCTGTEEYVLSKQVYTFEYEFERVITEFVKDGKEWQEIYWDTNGTSWKQRFNSLVVNVHFEKPQVATNETSCYVGSYGEKGSERCRTTKTTDGFSFSTSNLSRGENLTFVVELKAGSFKIPEPGSNYVMFAVLAGVLGFCALLLWRPIKKFKETATLRSFYKGYFVKPEYAPHEKYSLVEMATVYIGKKKDPKVALLLDMVVNNKIALVKEGENLLGKTVWAIDIKAPVSSLAEEERYILKILNGGGDLDDNDHIVIKRRSASSSLVSLGSLFEHSGVEQARKDKLVTKNFNNNSLAVAGKIFDIWLVLALLPFIMGGMTDVLVEGIIIFGDEAYLNGERIIGFTEICGIIAILLLTTLIVRNVLKSKANKFINYEEEGLVASKYMDGLKLYIQMAEKDRLEFLQSVSGVDVSDKGIVKLYEKLLPYAALFGVEDSWMKELGKYYEMADVEAPSWYDVHIFSSMTSAMRTASSYAASSTSYSGSGSGSSGFSGGGGGGFSGGGGGGGGGGGR